MKSKWPGINTKGTVLINLAYETFHLSKVLVLKTREKQGSESNYF